MTQAQLKTKLKGIPADRIAAVTCALIGHSRVQSQCFGYWNCARCGDQVGDTLGSSYVGAMQAVAVDHYCDTCRDNAPSLTWKDRFGLPPKILKYLDILGDPKRYQRRRAALMREQEKSRRVLKELAVSR